MSTFTPILSKHSKVDGDEEHQGLLSEAERIDDFVEKGTPSQTRTWSCRMLAAIGTSLIALLITGLFALNHLQGSAGSGRPSFTGAELRSNGTHEFKRTVLIVSIDGLRAGYLDRGLTPHLLDISKQGLRAKSMKPIFPTLTFPNHWSLLTGLYAESHGIVGNNFWDPVTMEEFHYNKAESSWDPTWWLGEPMWETAGKQGIITANLMWPGPPKTFTQASPTYFIPWRDKVPLEEKLEQILEWIDLPLQERPQLIMAYEPSVDQAGHATGPNSALVNHTLTQVDTFAKDLHAALVTRNLTSIVDVIFVSDHGMTDTSAPTPVYIDDIIGPDGMHAIEHEDGWPSMGLRFSPKANASKYIDLLSRAAEANPGRFEVYTRAQMPERYHFSANERIAPVYIIPKIGYILTTEKEGDTGMSKGNHGYDNEEESMQAMFVAHGPFSVEAKTLLKQRSLMTRWQCGNGWHTASGGEYVIEQFANVEIYNLVMKLLGIESHLAPNNGTIGFWDKFF